MREIIAASGETTSHIQRLRRYMTSTLGTLQGMRVPYDYTEEQSRAVETLNRLERDTLGPMDACVLQINDAVQTMESGVRQNNTSVFQQGVDKLKKIQLPN